MLQIRVEATTANLCVGFDVLGMSLGLYNYFTFDKRENVSFVGYAPEHCNLNNLCYTSYVYTFKKFNMAPIPLEFGFSGDVPVCRGLGSSSTLIVAGVYAANYYMGNVLSNKEMFDICVELEGHPDNVAPAIFGGLIASFKAQDGYHYIKYPVSDKLKFIAAIPKYMLSTHEARQVLPKSLEYKDIVNNLSRIVNIPYAFENGDISLIKMLFDDKLHEPYRGKLIEEYGLLKRLYENDNAAVAISGSGSTILIIADDEALSSKLDSLKLDYKLLKVGTGVEVKEI